ENPFGALCFYWPWRGEQGRVEGSLNRLSDQESDEYFATRPRESQLGAWASQQSEVLPSRGELEARLLEVEQRFSGQPIPRPPFWGGYLLLPSRIEFWRQGEGRLHHRELFSRSGGGWRMELLYP